MRIFKIFIFLSVFVSCILVATGQSLYLKTGTKNFNQLHDLLEKCNTDTDKLKVMLDLGSFFAQRNRDKTDLDSGMYYLNKAHILAAEITPLANDLKNESDCRLGEILISNGKVRQGEAYFLKAVANLKACGDK
ncbi:MAG: hypothetical protein M3O71_01755, partial [Bacteroidota bacterium]|nr:hypothetical protein [Bacteroidota bacterium]